MTVPDVKKEFGVSEPTIRRWISKEQAPTFFKIFGRVKTLSVGLSLVEYYK